MALIGGPMIRRPQTSHRIGLFHLNSFINLLLFIVFVLLITISCAKRLTYKSFIFFLARNFWLVWVWDKTLPHHHHHHETTDGRWRGDVGKQCRYKPSDLHCFTSCK
jgi:hypothetical protein